MSSRKSSPLILLALTLLLFFLFQPRLLSYFFPSVRAAKLNSFLTSLQTDGLDPRAFWQLREFYYPGGNFVVHKEALSPADLAAFSKRSGIILTPNDSYPILVYHSDKWESYEALVKTNELDRHFVLPETVKLVHENSESWVYRQADQTVLVFLTTLDNLRLTNGFINRDEEIISQYSHWLSLSVITP